MGPISSTITKSAAPFIERSNAATPIFSRSSETTTYDPTLGPVVRFFLASHPSLPYERSLIMKPVLAPPSRTSRAVYPVILYQILFTGQYILLLTVYCPTH